MYYKHHVQHFLSTYFTRERIEGTDILDFGCGPGFHAAMLAQCGAQILGIDQSPFLIAKGRELIQRLHLTNLDLVQGEFITTSCQWPAKIFDYILAIDTIVSFDHDKKFHCHSRVVNAFRCVARLLRDRGRFFVIESHPLFGHGARNVWLNGEQLCVRPGHYKFRDKPPGERTHWFTLEETTRAACEGGLLLLRIHEPEPSPALKEQSPAAYEFRMRYPAMIVYEFCRRAQSVDE